ncbi:MAG: Cytochrome oxidase biogenesis protein Surf1, facilitates heme A insertion [uncultured Nocardioidaceae bacterium]|uniref:SURF1-like protein n=1 Tax=uncultured Nocardioidaceae bacterium TaxID=253824 RepID=A0A6J4M2H5_9ACTN|nr:MAG: Cytochrome oxidase biogenesis protein Surf1, facilitates heme A insertion [uncultured Nocardioidaceae bacterium]
MLARRWVLFGLAVGLLALLCLRLGDWQFNRQHEREQRNEWTRANLAADPAPVEDVLALGGDVPAEREWMRVEATGRYDAAATVVVRYQSRDGQSGVDVVTPLVTSSGTAVLVDRGWLPTANTGASPDDLPAPPTGTVRVAGYVRADAEGGATSVDDGSTRAVSSETIGSRLDYPVYAGYVAVGAESPEPERPLVPVETPDLGEGPHFFYGLQWWFFAALAIFGFGYLAWDERRRMVSQPSRTADPRVSSR